MADNNTGNTGNQGGKKERKPLKLGGTGVKEFIPGQAGNFGNFVPQGQNFQPGYQQQGYGYQGGYNQGNQGYQGGYQQQGFGQGNQQFGGQQLSGNMPAYQPTYQQDNQQSVRPDTATKTNTQQARPTTSTAQGGNQSQTTTQAKPTTTTANTNVKKEEPKKKVEPKQPEPKVEAKKDTKKGGKVEKKTGSDAKKGKEEKKEGDGQPERSYTKLQNLMIAQKTMKPDKVDIEAAIKEKAKYDELVDETRQPVNIVFIGHVDAGKSTTCGQILLLTGQVDQADIRKLKQEAKEKNRESWWVAYLMDIGEEEKAKGKTVEVGKARFNTASKRFTILDAPGHKNYVPNMIAGASQADVAALVISAKTGEFEAGFEKGGQTMEHAMLAKSLGVKTLIVLVNKMDENTINWAKERFDHIKKTVTPYLRDSCGYDVEKEVYWVPYSGLNGENITEGIKDAKGSWYKGPTFFEVLDKLELPHRDPDGPLRIPVLDKYKDGSNSFVFGKVESGTIVHGSKLTLIPSGESLTIHAIYDDSDKRIPYARPGEGVKLHVKGIEDDYISRGDIISSNYSFPYVCNEFECEVRITELPEHKAIMSTGYNCVIHLHSALEEVYIKDIKSEYNKAEDKFKPAKYLKAGSTGVVVISTKSPHPICCEKADVMPHLGNFTLRDEGKTIAAGKIVRVKPVVKV